VEPCLWTPHNSGTLLMDTPQQWNPAYGHPTTVDTQDLTDNSESPDCPFIHFNT